MITPLQQQALFTLRQALALCDQAEIEILGEYSEIPYLNNASKRGLWRRRLSSAHIDDFERELSQ